MSRIPNIDLRRTSPLGEPYVPPKPKKPKRQIDSARVARIIVYTPFIAFLLALAIGIVTLFGPLVGIIIIFLFITKAYG